MTREIVIDRPIFIVACPRSGTTILQNLLGGHPDLAWFSNYTSRWPWLPRLAALSPLFSRRIPSVFEPYFPKPSEGDPLFDACIPKVWGLLTAADVTAEKNVCLKKSVWAHLNHHRRPRFMNKNIRNHTRIEYLNVIFPDAIFIHCIRDPIATIASLLNWKMVDYGSKDWLEGNYEIQDWEDRVKPVFHVAVNQWINANKIISWSQPTLGSRYLPLFYEDLTKDPTEAISKILAHCGLPWSGQYREFLSRYNVSNMNSKYEGQFTETHISIIEEMTRPLISELGYAY